jgi:hypothetical protein
MLARGSLDHKNQLLFADTFSHLSADAPPAGHGAAVHEDVSSIHNVVLDLHAFHLV